MEKSQAKMVSAIGPELKLILACINQESANKKKEEIETILKDLIDWELFVDLAVHHRVSPMVFSVLNDCTHSAIPDAVLNYLRKQKCNIAMANLQMTGELVRILRAMDAQDVKTVVLKGLPLANQLYGDITMRPLRDLDILVFPRDVEKAKEIVQEFHYRLYYPSFEPTPRRMKNWVKTNHHFSYQHEEKGVCLELHWRLGVVGNEIPLSLLPHGMHKVTLAGQPITVLANETLLIYLILHGALHAWFRLRWLCDVGLMLTNKENSWDKLYRLAEKLGLTAAVNQAVILAHELLGAPIPDRITAKIEKDKKAQRLVCMAQSMIVANSYLHDDLKINMLYYQKKMYELALRSGFKNKLAYLKAHFMPSDADLASVSISETLYPLYYLVRPITWLSRQVGKL